MPPWGRQRPMIWCWFAAVYSWLPKWTVKKSEAFQFTQVSQGIHDAVYMQALQDLVFPHQSLQFLHGHQVHFQFFRFIQLLLRRFFTFGGQEHMHEVIG